MRNKLLQLEDEREKDMNEYLESKRRYLEYLKEYYEKKYVLGQKVELLSGRIAILECFRIDGNIVVPKFVFSDNGLETFSVINSLNELEENDEPELPDYSIKDDNEIGINGRILDGSEIVASLTDHMLDSGDSKYEFRISHRDSCISDLERFICETESDSDRELMREDLAYLNKSNEEFLFERISTNGFIAKDIDEDKFNKICRNYIIIQKFNVNAIVNNWTKACYHYSSFESYLEDVYGLSEDEYIYLLNNV